MKRTIFFLIITTIISSSMASELQNECTNFYNKKIEFKQNMSIEKTNHMQMYKDDRVVVDCNAKDIDITFKGYSDDLTHLKNLPTLKNIKLNFEEFDGKEKSKEFVNSFFFDNLSFKPKEIKIKFEKNSKAFTYENILPEKIYDAKSEYIEIDCNNNSIDWDIKKDAKSLKVKFLLIKNCKISNVNDLYEIYANKIKLKNIKANDIIIPNRFKNSNNVEILKK